MSDSFKTRRRPAMCTSSLFASLPTASNDVLNNIRQESIQLYGKDLLAECDKRLVCFGVNCLGRALPVLSPSAQPYITELTKTHKIENGQLFINTNCGACELSRSCKSLCAQNTDFINRDRVIPPDIQFQPNIDVSAAAPITSIRTYFENENHVIPWDVLSAKKEKLVKAYLYEGKDFNQTANSIGIKSASHCRYMFYCALTTLSEAAAVRKLLTINQQLTVAERTLLELLYVRKYTVSQCAKVLNVSKQAISGRKQRIFSRHNVRWLVFVRKQNGKVVYNVPKVLK